MADDLDFVWAPTQTASVTTTERPRARPAGTAAVEWVTLREAAERTHIPVSTIRNWARKEKIPTRISDQAAGRRRMVGMGQVVTRANELGRLGPAPAEPAATKSEAVIDLTHSGGDHAVPEGHMLVPLDAWEKMLVQLGNLHEAGQDLASARERAAKAETEAQFLRERVADLRDERDRLRDGAAPARAEVQPEPAPPAWYRWLTQRFRNR